MVPVNIKFRLQNIEAFSCYLPCQTADHWLDAIKQFHQEMPSTLSYQDKKKDFSMKKESNFSNTKISLD